MGGCNITIDERNFARYLVNSTLKRVSRGYDLLALKCDEVTQSSTDRENAFEEIDKNTKPITALGYWFRKKILGYREVVRAA